MAVTPQKFQMRGGQHPDNEMPVDQRNGRATGIHIFRDAHAAKRTSVVGDHDRVNEIGQGIQPKSSTSDGFHEVGPILVDDGLFPIQTLGFKPRGHDPDNGHHGEGHDRNRKSNLHHGESVLDNPGGTSSASCTL